MGTNDPGTGSVHILDINPPDVSQVGDSFMVDVHALVDGDDVHLAVEVSAEELLLGDLDSVIAGKLP